MEEPQLAADIANFISDFLIQYIEYWDCKPFFSRELTEKEMEKKNEFRNS